MPYAVYSVHSATSSSSCRHRSFVQPICCVAVGERALASYDQHQQCSSIRSSIHSITHFNRSLQSVSSPIDQTGHRSSQLFPAIGCFPRFVRRLARALSSVWLSVLAPCMAHLSDKEMVSEDDSDAFLEDDDDEEEVVVELSELQGVVASANTAGTSGGTSSGSPQRSHDGPAHVPFSTLCDLFEKSIVTSKVALKKRYLQALFSAYSKSHYFSLLRLLVPQVPPNALVHLAWRCVALRGVAWLISCNRIARQGASDLWYEGEQPRQVLRRAAQHLARERRRSAPAALAQAHLQR